MSRAAQTQRLDVRSFYRRARLATAYTQPS